MNPAFEATVTFAPHLARTPSPSPMPAWLRAWARPLRPVPRELLDRGTGLYNRTGLMAAANEAIAALSPAQACSMIVLDFADLREVWDIYGMDIAQKVVTRLVSRLRALAGWRGLVGRTGPAQFTVVMPGVSEQKAQRQVRRVLGRPARIEFDAGDSEIVLVPDWVMDSAEAGAPRARDLYCEMCRELARMQKDERLRLHYLASERERHSRPMPLPGLR